MLELVTYDYSAGSDIILWKLSLKNMVNKCFCFVYYDYCYKTQTKRWLGIVCGYCYVLLYIIMQCNCVVFILNLYVTFKYICYLNRRLIYETPIL